jgi:hypothetical protein
MFDERHGCTDRVRNPPGGGHCKQRQSGADGPRVQIIPEGKEERRTSAPNEGKRRNVALGSYGVYIETPVGTSLSDAIEKQSLVLAARKIEPLELESWSTNNLLF